jgi:hypothetical protein
MLSSLWMSRVCRPSCPVATLQNKKLCIFPYCNLFSIICDFRSFWSTLFFCWLDFPIKVLFDFSYFYPMIYLSFGIELFFGQWLLWKLWRSLLIKHFSFNLSLFPTLKWGSCSRFNLPLLIVSIWSLINLANMSLKKGFDYYTYSHLEPILKIMKRLKMQLPRVTETCNKFRSSMDYSLLPLISPTLVFL